MSINIGRINISPVNRARIESEEIYISTMLSSSIASFVTRGTNVYTGQTLSSSVGSAAKGARGFVVSMTANSTVSSYAVPTIRRSISAHMRTVGAQHAMGSLNAYVSGAIEAHLYGAALLGKNILRSEQMASAISKSLLGAKNLHTGNIRMNSVLSQTASTVLFAFIDAMIDVDIPTGATLVIDSSGYVVLLDGENVIWAHSGDWPYFARETYDVEFSTPEGALIEDGALQYRVLYTERYL